MKPALRPATSDDAASLAAVSLEVWLSTYIKHGVSAAFARYALNAFTPENFRSYVADPDCRVFVSDNRDGPDGYVMLRARRACPLAQAGIAPFEIDTLYVQPRHGRKGIGRALLERALIAAKEAGAASVWIAVNSENAAALAFYIACGFEDVGETHFVLDGISYPNRVFAKRLG